MRATGLDTVLPRRALILHSLEHWLPPASCLSHSQFMPSFISLRSLLMYICHSLLVGRVHGGAAMDVEVYPGSMFSSLLPCPAVVISLGQRQGGDNSPRFARVSACLYLCTTFSYF